jgi:hypothetical protein
MHAPFTTSVLALFSAFSLLTAYSAFRAPKLFGQRIGFEISTADGLNEVRAQYGGFYLLIAIVGALAIFGKLPVTAALLLTTVVFGGLITGRFVSLALDGGWQSYGRGMIRALFLIDFFGAALSTLALSASLA